MPASPYVLTFSTMLRLANSRHRHVILKLLAFTLAMVVGPIGTYFLTLNIVFKGTAA